jgi:hypothetical protein
MMPINNDTTAVPAHRSIAERQDARVKHGATGVLDKYEQGTRRIEALPLLFRVHDRDVTCALPVPWKRFQRVLPLHNVARSKHED